MIEGASYVKYGYDAAVELVGDKGIIRVARSDKEFLSLTVEGQTSQPFIDSWRTLFEDAYLREDEAFIYAVRNGEPPRVGGLDGLMAVRIVNTGNEALQRCGDTAASALGAGVTQPGMALDVAGTALVLVMSTAHFAPDTAKRTLLYMRSVLDGRYTPLAYIGGGGLCIRWAGRLLRKTYNELENLAQDVPLGSAGLRFIPHFAGRYQNRYKRRC